MNELPVKESAAMMSAAHVEEAVASLRREMADILEYINNRLCAVERLLGLSAIGNPAFSSESDLDIEESGEEEDA